MPKKKLTSEYKGVWFDSGKQKWLAKIEIDGKIKHLGRFKTEKEAAISYCQSAAAHWLAVLYILKRND